MKINLFLNNIETNSTILEKWILYRRKCATSRIFATISTFDAKDIFIKLCFPILNSKTDA